MERSSRREKSRERHNKKRSDRSRDSRRHHRRSDDKRKNERNIDNHKKRSRSRSRRSRHKRSVSRHCSRTPDKIEDKRLISGTSSVIDDNTTKNLLNDDATLKIEKPKVKRKSRWAGTVDDKVYVPGIPSILPSYLNAEQQEAYLLQLNIGEISSNLRSGKWEIPENPQDRSPSPEPIYNVNGTRLNTREFRIRAKLEEQRHDMVLRLKALNPAYLPPSDYKPPSTRLIDKIMIPQEEYPETNFVGLIIGPRGNTLKRMEQETGAKIIIRGKGSVKEGKTANKTGEPLPGENEPLHAYISATNPESLKNAIEKVQQIIKQGIETPEGENNLRKMQLRELAVLNGTLRDGCENRCTNCGSTDHKSWLCPDKPIITNTILCGTCGSAGHIAKDCKQEPILQDDSEIPAKKIKIDEEYLALMAEIGEAPAGVQGTSKQTVNFKTIKKNAPLLNPVAPPLPTPSIEANPSTEMVEYPMPNINTMWNQSSAEQLQMTIPWHTSNMQQMWMGNQFPWPNPYSNLPVVPPSLPIDVNNYLFNLAPPPPPPPPSNQ